MNNINRHDVAPSDHGEIIDLGYPSLQNIFSRPGIVASYNSERKVANWVFECLTEHQVNNYLPLREWNSFYEDPNIAERATLADYNTSIYKKGFLAAAENHLYNYNAFRSAYCLTNIVPMYENTSHILEKINIEARVLAVMNGRAYICTGPVYDERRTICTIGGGVHVPHSIFKVIIVPERFRNFQYSTLSFEVENSKNVSLQEDKKDWKKKLSVINQVTGLNILSGVDMDVVFDACYNSRRSIGA